MAERVEVRITARDQSRRGIQSAQRNLQRFTRTLTRIAGPLAAAFSVRAIQNFTREAITAGARIQDTARKLGLGVESLQELRFAAEQYGIANNQLDIGLQRFTRRVSEAAQGSGEAIAALRELGVLSDIQAGNFANTDEILAAVADGLKETGSQADRVRLAFKLFDSEGVALVNILQGGSEAIEDFRSQARELGLVMDRQTTARAKALDDQLGVLSRTISVDVNRAFIALGDTLVAGETGIAGFIDKIATFIESMRELPERSTQALESALKGTLTELRTAGNLIQQGADLFGLNTKAAQSAAERLSEILTELKRRQDEATDSARELEDAAAAGKLERAMLGSEARTQALRDQVRLLRTELEFGDQAAAIEKIAIEFEKAARAAGGFAEEVAVAEQLRLAKLEELERDAAEKRAKIRQEIAIAGIENETEREIAERQVRAVEVFQERMSQAGDDAELAAAASEDLARSLEKARDEAGLLGGAFEDLKDFGGDVFEGLARSASDIFTSFIDGTQDAGEAFANFAQDVLRQLQEILIRIALLKALEAGAGALGVTLPQGFAEGGIVTRPTLALIGEDGPEAVVPLREQRPGLGVGLGLGQINTTVLVNVRAGGVDSAVQGDGGASANELGRQISGVVVREILEQQRPGGLLAVR